MLNAPKPKHTVDHILIKYLLEANILVTVVPVTNINLLDLSQCSRQLQSSPVLCVDCLWA